MASEAHLAWLIAREIPQLRRFAAMLTRDPAAVDDLVQDCLERALRKQHLWQRRGTLRSWLFRLLYRRYIDQQRSRRARRRLMVEADAQAAGRIQPAAQEDNVIVANIADAMDRLPPEQRAAILLVSVEGMSYAEAASTLGIAVGTLRSRLSRGRDRLRSTWQPESQITPLRRVK